MGFPNKAQVEKALKKLEKMEGAEGPPENPTPLEELRYDLHQKFVWYKLKNKISQKEMADILGVDEGKVSKLLRNRLEEFSTDRMINLLSKLSPNIKLKVG